MPDAMLKLTMNPKTGERTLTIQYESDPDALSFEHEDDHRAFVEALLGQPLREVADRLEIERTPPLSPPPERSAHPPQLSSAEPASETPTEQSST